MLDRRERAGDVDERDAMAQDITANLYTRFTQQIAFYKKERETLFTRINQLEQELETYKQLQSAINDYERNRPSSVQQGKGEFISYRTAK
jgi:cell division protein FtsB